MSSERVWCEYRAHYDGSRYWSGVHSGYSNSGRAVLADLIGSAAFDELPFNWAWANQVHSSIAVNVTEPGLQGSADALWTTAPNIGLLIQTADCVPIILFSDNGVGLIHAGWRGIVNGVIQNTVLQMRKECSFLKAIIAPCISQDCYEVGEEVVSTFIANGIPREVFCREASPRPYIDLRSAVTHLLAALDVELLYCDSRCTYSDTTLASYRRDGPLAARIITAVALL